MRNNTNPRDELVAQVEMALLVALAEDMTDPVAEGCRVVPVGSGVWRSDSVDLADDLGVVSDQVVRADASEMAW